MSSGDRFSFRATSRFSGERLFHADWQSHPVSFGSRWCSRNHCRAVFFSDCDGAATLESLTSLSLSHNRSSAERLSPWRYIHNSFNSAAVITGDFKVWAAKVQNCFEWRLSGREKKCPFSPFINPRFLVCSIIVLFIFFCFIIAGKNTTRNPVCQDFCGFLYRAVY